MRKFDRTAIFHDHSFCSCCCGKCVNRDYQQTYRKGRLQHLFHWSPPIYSAQTLTRNQLKNRRLLGCVTSDIKWDARFVSLREGRAVCQGVHIPSRGVSTPPLL